MSLYLSEYSPVAGVISNDEVPTLYRSTENSKMNKYTALANPCGTSIATTTAISFEHAAEIFNTSLSTENWLIWCKGKYTIRCVDTQKIY